MKNSIILSVLMPLLLMAVFVAQTQASEVLRAAVSIPPQVYFLEKIGGTHVETLCLLPAGALPHSYEPTARQMKELSQADLYVRIGVQFETAWWEKFSSVNPAMHVIDSGRGIEFLSGHAHTAHNEHRAEHRHEGHDPHVWLSPRTVKILVDNMYQGLAAIDPDHQESYRSNADAFLEELETLDAEIRERLSSVTTRKFMIFHPAWSYFARDYDLEQIPVEIEGKEPSAREMVDLMKRARHEQIRIIFVQPQTSRRSAETIARQIGGQVEVLDPLAADWLDNMRRAAALLAKALSE
ncbi:cation ABC transporter substrate-binding protein [candidate division KSB3 bacterium]|uniref:Cation ABC transporter substrate-binding protein n=1 Tax=candidate division KSB3 bacterium TaxID=2044937 RepID=A0A2G6E712_9BACT|nr:MAG: cation ABC transporter substrate-binding protein [candidate division KSB3 bacterium]PIE30140.1 MAG: cation ABC transporter substrate-binding protein [candidate division KSB3 bacterium]